MARTEDSRTELTMIKVALRNYNLKPETRQRMVQRAEQLLESDKIRVQLAAIKALATLDMIDVRRETNEITERHDQVMESAAGIRAALAIPGVREQLAALTEVSDVNAVTESAGATSEKIGDYPAVTDTPGANNINGHAHKNGKSGPGHGLNGNGKPH